MKKIAIIGSGGSGKSTLAKQLGTQLNLPVHHLDALLWKANWTAASKEEQKTIQRELVKNEKWIIDGNYNGTLDIRLNAADTIIFVDINRWICICRVIKRRIHYHGRSRPDMGEGCVEKLDLNFLKWIWDYPKTKRPETINKLRNLRDDQQIIFLKSPKEVQQFLKTTVEGGRDYAEKYRADKV